ncbi:hypothetical protein GBZ26_25055 [Azospirillum formosense]|uniref:Uncharacterized protein n=1 Tax=Azospirillum formosense TaxID=861533 RepID=A0ABX2LAX6_9PROT|nr:hypothetical protein [Azospirillum formosense]MBY3753923.1 hypothetical protein [Azospirillum formosense]NUB22440.1 hypothetical protein [Azospirillum formosense]
MPEWTWLNIRRDFTRHSSDHKQYSQSDRLRSHHPPIRLECVQTVEILPTRWANNILFPHRHAHTAPHQYQLGITIRQGLSL